MPDERKKINKGTLEVKLKSYRASDYYENRLGGTTLFEILHYKGKCYPGQVVAFLIKAVREFVGLNPVADVLFMALGLLRGYDKITGIGERRIKYLNESNYLEHFYKKEFEAYKLTESKEVQVKMLANFSEGLRKKEDRYIEDLALSIALIEDISAYVNDLDGYALKSSSQDRATIYRPFLPMPSYTVDYTLYENFSPSETSPQSVSDRIDAIEKIAEYVKDIPSISEGVSEANTKLDDVLELTARTARIVELQQADIDAVAAIRLGKTRNIKFGHHEWRVLDIHDDKALLLTENIIARQPYQNEGTTMTTWETCSLRKYLNNNFYKRFHKEAQARILTVRNTNPKNQWFGSDVDAEHEGFLQRHTNGRSDNDTEDKIFLLSIGEVVKYFGDSGQLQDKNPDSKYWIDDCFNYVRVAEYNGKTCSWWLRSPGSHLRYAAYIDGGDLEEGFDDVDEDSLAGYIQMSGEVVNAPELGVRPALWLSLSDVIEIQDDESIGLQNDEPEEPSVQDERTENNSDDMTDDELQDWLNDLYTP